MKHAIFLMFGLVASGCGAQAIPPAGQMVEVRLVDWSTRNCYYMWPNSHVESVQRPNVEVNGLCPEYLAMPMVAK